MTAGIIILSAASRRELRWPGQIGLTSSQSRSAQPTVIRGVIEKTNRQEPEHERPRVAPEPDVLVQHVEHGHESGGEAFMRINVSPTEGHHARRSPIYVWPGHDDHRRTHSFRSRRGAHGARRAGPRSRRLALRSGDRLPVLARVRAEARLGSPARDQRLRAISAGFGAFEDEWLRGGPVQRWIPKGLAGKPVFVFETGGTTGIPKTRVAFEDFRTDYELFSDTLPDEYFPRGSNWLMLGPSGPRRLRLSVEHLAQYRGGICFCVDLDPRWVIKLIKKGWSEHLEAYKAHVIDQAVTILQAGHDIRCMFTTPKLLEALALKLESMGTTIRKMGITGIFSGGTEFTPQWNRFAHEELLDGAYMTPTYGNTLMGLAASSPSGPHNNYKITYYAPQPRAVDRGRRLRRSRASWSTTGRPGGSS